MAADDQSNSNLMSSNNKHSFISDDDGWSSESSGTSRRRSVAASLRDFAESMMRREAAEMEMVKAREAARIAAENRRLERENELMEMVLKTQLEITSFLCSITGDRKRKRREEEEDDDDGGGGGGSPELIPREGAMLLSLLQFNLGTENPISNSKIGHVAGSSVPSVHDRKSVCNGIRP